MNMRIKNIDVFLFHRYRTSVSYIILSWECLHLRLQFGFAALSELNKNIQWKWAFGSTGKFDNGT